MYVISMGIKVMRQQLTSIDVENLNVECDYRAKYYLMEMGIYFEFVGWVWEIICWNTYDKVLALPMYLSITLQQQK